MPLWAVNQAWAGSACYGAVTIMEQSDFFVVACYSFSMLNSLQWIESFGSQDQDVCISSLGFSMILSVILNPVSCLKLE